MYEKATREELDTVYWRRKERKEKLATLGLDAIFSFSSLPVKIFLYSCLIGVILIFFSVIDILIGKLTVLATVRCSSIILSIYFIGSVQLVTIGILGEYMFSIYR